LAIYVGKSNRLGQPVSVSDAEQHIFGIGLLNDWSARDIQFWEMAPLGPFLGKSFATTISPWIVSLEALAPFRLPFERPAGDPPPLPYLDAKTNRAAGAIDITLEVWLGSSKQRALGVPSSRVSITSFKHQYWTVAQMLAHHTINGCNLNVGDVIGSGTVSGPTVSEAGALNELALNGAAPVELATGENRSFLEMATRWPFGDIARSQASLGSGSANAGARFCQRSLPALQSHFELQLRDFDARPPIANSCRWSRGRRDRRISG
jgi:fumarylacetoacetase